MSNMSSLNELVMAISSSVLEAQEKIEAAQLGNLMSYFKRKPDESGFFPLTMTVNLPSMRPDAPVGVTDAYTVPYLSVLPYSALRIKQMDVDFDVSFGALSSIEESTSKDNDPDNPYPERAENMPNLSIDMGSIKKGNNVLAHVHLSLEGVDLPEGAARLINELIKSNQVYEQSAEAVKPDNEGK